MARPPALKHDENLRRLAQAARDVTEVLERQLIGVDQLRARQGGDLGLIERRLAGAVGAGDHMQDRARFDRHRSADGPQAPVRSSLDEIALLVIAHGANDAAQGGIPLAHIIAWRLKARVELIKNRLLLIGGQVLEAARATTA